MITLTARVNDENSFTFIPSTWEKELKPLKTAKWTHEVYNGKTEMYELKSGAFLAFPSMTDKGGLYAANLYMIVKEFDCKQVKGTFTDYGLTLESVEGELKTRVTLKLRGMTEKDTAHIVTM